MIDNVKKRYAAGKPHNIKSHELFNSLIKLDGELGDSSFLDFSLSTGEYENSEYLLYLLDMHFELEDTKVTQEHGLYS